MVTATHPATAPSSGSSTTVDARRIHGALEKVVHPDRINPLVAASGIAAWVLFSLVSWFVPNSADLPQRNVENLEDAAVFALVGGVVVAAAWSALWLLAVTRAGEWAHRRVSNGSAWVLGSGLWLLVWELTTAKAEILSPPYFVAPQEIAAVLWNDAGLLFGSVGNSMLLLIVGFLVGLASGLVTGVTIGWFQAANYWVHPILIFIGPVPTLAWVPIVFVLAPSAFSGAVFMIALSVWFPVAVLTRAGVLGVPRPYFDVAQTLGARGWFLVFRVSLPAALPNILTGVFMALGASFASLVVAENFGVNSGIGWYLTWKKSWGDFNGLYAGIIVLVVICGAALTLLFRIRSWALRWEKELTRW
ncbi:MAG: ABC transporter permease [Corynebacterium sp.]|uniref:ABC transporter permease n=1 Tax=Corynebacterium sp. TaxID=1720 RepID=UPI003F95BC41